MWKFTIKYKETWGHRIMTLSSSENKLSDAVKDVALTLKITSAELMDSVTWVEMMKDGKRIIPTL